MDQEWIRFYSAAIISGLFGTGISLIAIYFAKGERRAKTENLDAETTNIDADTIQKMQRTINQLADDLDQERKERCNDKLKFEALLESLQLRVEELEKERDRLLIENRELRLRVKGS